MKKTRLGMLIVFIMSIIIILSACGEKGSQGLEYKSNGDKTCAVVGIGSCEDENVVIPEKSPDGDTVTSIADNAFEKSDIRTLSMANTIIEIGSEAFSKCDKLENIKFSKNLKRIGDYAFSECDSLTEICLPNSLEELGTKSIEDGREVFSYTVFYSCENLSKVNIPKNLKSLHHQTFKYTPVTDIRIDADFKYGDFHYVINKKAWHTVIFDMYQTKPEDPDVEFLELGEDLKKLSYASFFNSETLKINGKELVLPEPKCTPGFYGAEDDPTAYNIRKDGKLEILTYNSDSGEYEVKKNYFDGNKECVYDFEYDEASNGYVYRVKSGYDYFVVYDNYFFDGGHQAYALNVKYKG